MGYAFVAMHLHAWHDCLLQLPQQIPMLFQTYFRGLAYLRGVLLLHLLVYVSARGSLSEADYFEFVAVIADWRWSRRLVGC